MGFGQVVSVGLGSGRSTGDGREIVGDGVIKAGMRSESSCLLSVAGSLGRGGKNRIRANKLTINSVS